MGKLLIVQPRAIWETLILLVLIVLATPNDAADLVIELPGGVGSDEGLFRLDYRPPEGQPAPNFTVPARASTINFQGLPGTKYHFMLYYSNGTFADLLTWNQTIVTAPEPPTDLTVTLGRNKQATIGWAPPAHGDYTGFRFRVAPLGDEQRAYNLSVDSTPERQYSLALKELSPGATYQLHAFTLLHDKESAAYASRNFTTKPNTPGKFIVWFRNETTLLVLWQPPYPPGAYTHYKVSIVPPDAKDSELYVEKEGEPPGPAQAAFKGLLPGRAYNISVQTVAEPELSAPTTAQYRTVPLRPTELKVEHRTETTATLVWQPPKELSEFEKYQVSLSPLAGAGAGSRRPTPLLRSRDDVTRCELEALEPGATYSVSVKTMSGKVTSWPAVLDLTLKPLGVRSLSWREAGDEVEVAWAVAGGSTQDAFRVQYEEAGGGDSGGGVWPKAPARLTALLPGRNYTVRVAAVSRGVAGAESSLAVLTRPLAPALREATSPSAGRLRLAWTSDVDSRQDRYEVRWRRVDPPPERQEERGELATGDTSCELSDLMPGAVYELSVAALGHGLKSAPAVFRRPTRPLPPTRMWVERTGSNSAVVKWRVAAEGALGEVVLRYRTGGAWTRLSPLAANVREAEIVDMTYGERYTIQLETASLGGGGERLESGAPLEESHGVRPAPVSNVAALVEARNMTVEWPRGAGRVDAYSVAWWRRDAGDSPDPHNETHTAPPVRLHNLFPGAGYTLAVAAHSYNLTSDLFSMDTRTRPLIQSEMTIVTQADEEMSPAFLVVFTRTPLTATRFDHYRFRLETALHSPEEQLLPADAPLQQLRFTHLSPGALYNITMWTLSHDVTSHPVQRQARLFPLAVRDLSAVNVSAREVRLVWTQPKGAFTDFEVQWLHAEDRLAAKATAEASLTVDGLRPHTNYTFSVETRSGTPATLLTRSTAASVSVTTSEAPPDAPQRFQPNDATPTEAAFAWIMPDDSHNGRLLRFTLQVLGDGDERSLPLAPEQRETRVDRLRPGHEYRFRLWAENSAGAGPAAEWAQRMPIAAPPRPPPSAVVNARRRSTSTVAVEFRKDYFSAANGDVTAYTLVVGERPGNASARLPSWREVRALPVWPPYQVTEPYYPFQSSSVEHFTIGSERCEPGGRPYCNGPLKPNTKYFVKLRAFTAPDKFTDTEYTLIYTDADHTPWVAGGSVVVVAFGVALAAWVTVRRRRLANAKPKPPGLGAAPRLSRPVRVADFLDHYRLMSADSDFRFSEEFEELKHVGREQPCTAADLPCNRPKNRFTNILPYDHSRYKLQPVDDEEGSDYINANYVPGHRSPREFIVTQGPLHCTRDDFWRMCWESSSRAIVMLTRCVEKGREKCDRYWPSDTRPTLYGDIAVTVLNESRHTEWTTTELLVARGAEQRVLLHLHFTTWPDFGVPSPPTALARFVRAFRERVPSETQPRPTVVHCSAGVGRSGTFVTLDRALQQLDEGRDAIDIFGMVAALRRERVWMVQTEQQYICVHQCVAAALEGQDLAPRTSHMQHNAAYDDDEGIAESGI